MNTQAEATERAKKVTPFGHQAQSALDFQRFRKALTYALGHTPVVARGTVLLVLRKSSSMGIWIPIRNWPRCSSARRWLIPSATTSLGQWPMSVIGPRSGATRMASRTTSASWTDPARCERRGRVSLDVKAPLDEFEPSRIADDPAIGIAHGHDDAAVGQLQIEETVVNFGPDVTRDPLVCWNEGFVRHNRETATPGKGQIRSGGAELGTETLKQRKCHRSHLSTVTG